MLKVFLMEVLSVGRWHIDAINLKSTAGCSHLMLVKRSKEELKEQKGLGTRIAPRPPDRSRRALLTHRAPPLGQTSCDEHLVPLLARRTAIIRIDAAFRLSVRTAAP